MRDVVSGEGRTGRVGFVSTLKDLINETESDEAPEFEACW